MCYYLGTAGTITGYALLPIDLHNNCINYPYICTRAPFENITRPDVDHLTSYFDNSTYDSIQQTKISADIEVVLKSLNLRCLRIL